MILQRLATSVRKQNGVTVLIVTPDELITDAEAGIFLNDAILFRMPRALQSASTKCCQRAGLNWWKPPRPLREQK